MMVNCLFRGDMPKTGAPAPSCSACPRLLDLKRLRKKAGVSLEEIAEATKISLRFLRAIEDEEFDKLPGGIFCTSYLRQYAIAISVDPAELLAAHDLKMAPSTDSAAQMPATHRSFLGRWLGVPAS
jgi:hypothetical protein